VGADRPPAARGARPWLPTCWRQPALFEGMVWMARTSAQWRRLPDKYGNWNSVFRRYHRWVLAGVFEAMLETLSTVAKLETTADMIDSTVVRAHHCAVGLKKGIRNSRDLAVREAASRPSCTPAATLRDDRYALS
jgi:transposase